MRPFESFMASATSLVEAEMETVLTGGMAARLLGVGATTGLDWAGGPKWEPKLGPQQLCQQSICSAGRSKPVEAVWTNERPKVCAEETVGLRSLSPHSVS